MVKCSWETLFIETGLLDFFPFHRVQATKEERECYTYSPGTPELQEVPPIAAHGVILNMYTIQSEPRDIP